MTESETTTAMAFVETCGEYRIALTESDAHKITKDVSTWREAMRWINALERFLSLGLSLPAAPSMLRRHLNGEQLAGKRESFLPEPRAIKPLPAQLDLFA